MEPESLSRLIAQLYRDIPHTHGWENFLNELRRNVPFTSCTLTIDDHTQFSGDRSLHFELPENLDAAYSGYFIDKDVWALAALKRAPLTFYTSEQLLDDQSYLKSEIYNELLKAQDIRRCCGAYLENPQSHNAIKLALHRNHSQTPFSKDEAEALTLLVPHLQNALSLHRRFDESDTLNEALDNLSAPSEDAVFVLRRNRRVVRSNTKADNMIRSKIVRLKEECLHFTNNALDNAVTALLQETFSGIDGSMSTPRQYASVGAPPNCFQLRTEPTPLPSTIPGFREMGALLHIKHNDAKPKLDLHGLQTLFGLTASEARIVRLLCQGHSPQDIGASLNVKQSTVRSHIKAVYTKLAVNHQTELVSKMLSSLAADP